MNAIRKLFIDSRSRSSGYHNNFTVELPTDVDTSRTTSVYLASCSFSNTFQSVISGVNQNFYFILRRGSSTFCIAYALPAGQYSGASLATALQSMLDTTQGPLSTTVVLDAQGQLTFSAQVGVTYQFPTASELRDPAWQASNWLGAPYNLSDPQDLNGQLHFPFPSSPKNVTVTSNIDLVPYREVYLHSSITEFRTLKLSGERDCLARVPIDQDFGNVVVYRHLGPSDSIGCSDKHFRVLSFSFRDWEGKLVPIDQPVTIELVFLENDPYTI
jgi:hypothetical protein